MGHGIAQISAANGFQVVAVESSEQALNVGMGRISGSLDKVIKKDVEKGKMTEVRLISNAQVPLYPVAG